MKNPVCFAISFLLLMFLSVSAGANNDLASFSPVFPGECEKADQHEYFVLPNGLKVLLMSDATANESRVVLDVSVGYRDDPEDIPGMAHFLEHMLFQGTKKNPKYDTYKTLLASRGGDSNASTAYDWTNYHFNVDPEHLGATLELFSDQFKTPLFNEDYIENEKKVINAESSYRKDGLYRNLMSVAKDAFFEDHPFKKFSTGNSESLSKFDKPTLANKMREWWHENYSSEKMSLVIYGPNSIAEKKALAEKYFSDIPVFKGRNKKVYAPLKPKGELPRIAKAVIDDEERAMLLIFPMQNLKEDELSAAGRFIEYLLERKLPFSFVNNLKGRRFASDIYAEVVNRDDSSFIEIYIDLWYKGGERYWEVIQQLMFYVNQLKREPLEKWRIDEFNRSQALNWCYFEEVDIERYARNLTTFDPKYVFSKDYEIQKYTPEIYAQVLGSIRVDNMLAVVSHPHFSGSEESKWYSVEYEQEHIPENRHKNFQPEKNKKYYMDRPGKNPYLPSEMIVINDSIKGLPTKIDVGDNFNAWYARDTSFDDPRSFYYLNLKSKTIDDSRTNAVVANILEELIEEQLKYRKATAEDGNNDLTISRLDNGIGIYFEGYPDSISMLINEVLEKLNDFTLRKKEFERYRYGWMYYLKESEDIHPITQTRHIKSDLLEGPSFSYSEQYKGARGSRKSYVYSLLKDLKNDLSITSLSYGNVTKEQALEWNKKVADNLVGKKKLFESVDRVTKLPQGVSRVLSETIFDDSVSEVYVQGHADSHLEKASFRLLHYLMAEKFFSALRTEQQQGYAVNATALRYKHIPGFRFRIQSPYSGPDSLESDILAFLEGYITTLTEMDKDEFDAAKKALLNELQEVPETLEVAVDKVWRGIQFEKNQFDYSQQQYEAIAHLTKKEFTDWYLDRFIKVTKRVLSVLIEGEAHDISSDWEDKVEDTIIDSFEDFNEDNERWTLKRL